MASKMKEISMKPYYIGLALQVLLFLVAILVILDEEGGFPLTVFVGALIIYFGLMGWSLKDKSKTALVILFALLLLITLPWLYDSFEHPKYLVDGWYFYLGMLSSISLSIYYLIKLWKVKK